MRRAAKAQLIQLGPGAIPALLEPLEDTADYRNGNLLPNSEHETQEYRAMGLIPPDDQKLEDRRAEIRANGWLLDDICEVVGKLRAEAAVPLLIRIMEEQETWDPAQHWFPEREALVAIGPAAVPYLIENDRGR